MDEAIRGADRYNPERAQDFRCRAGVHEWSRPARVATFWEVIPPLGIDARICKHCLQLDFQGVRTQHQTTPTTDLPIAPFTALSTAVPFFPGNIFSGISSVSGFTLTTTLN